MGKVAYNGTYIGVEHGSRWTVSQIYQEGNGAGNHIELTYREEPIQTAGITAERVTKEIQEQGKDIQEQLFLSAKTIEQNNKAAAKKELERAVEVFEEKAKHLAHELVDEALDHARRRSKVVKALTVR